MSQESTRWAGWVLAGFWLAGCGDPSNDNGSAPSAYERADAQNAWFTEITPQTGIRFERRTGTQGDYFMPEILGSGGAIFDYDGDGDLDVYLVNSNLEDPSQTGSDGAVDRLYRQEEDGTFRDVTATAGLNSRGYGMGCAVGDADNDGDIDLYLTRFGADAFYRNNGDGTFSEATEQSGFSGKLWSTSAGFLDYDRDGFLDLYVAHYVDYSRAGACTDRAGRPEYCGPEAFRGQADTLCRNNGDGTFRDVSRESGIAQAEGKGLGVVFADFDQDGWTDIYVANDGQENHLWINQRDGSFQNEALVRGAALNMFARPEASMGVTIGDVDGDGLLDLFMTHLNRESNTLYRNLGRGQFEDATATSGMGAPSLPYTGFGTAFFDADHDGDLDLVAANGRVRRSQGESRTRFDGDKPASPASGFQLDDYAEPNQFFENDGSGRFEDASPKAGRLTSLVEISRAVLVADWDADGDLDLLVTQGAGPARLFRNDVPKRGNWLQVRAFDPRLRRDALGATVVAQVGGRHLVRVATSAFSYLAANPSSVHFGLGPATQVQRITVYWPDGLIEDFPSAAANQFLQLERGRGRTHAE